jgi:hypothetical protein
MSVGLLTSRDAVLAATREFDALGRDAFLFEIRFWPGEELLR